MIKLDELSMLDLIPASIGNDADIHALSKAIDKQMQEVTQEIVSTILLPRIDELPEDVVDCLAWQLHVDFYEPLGLDLDKKRALVKNSISWHRRKGTKSVLEEMLRILFLEDFKLEEWYEYGGRPYFFRLIIRDNIEDEQQYNDMIRAIQELKNIRSWLEKVQRQREIKCGIYFGQAIRHVRKNKIGAALPVHEIEPAELYIGAIAKHKRHFTVVAQLERKMDDINLYTGHVFKHTKKTKIGMREVANGSI